MSTKTEKQEIISDEKIEKAASAVRENRGKISFILGVLIASVLTSVVQARRAAAAEQTSQPV